MKKITCSVMLLFLCLPQTYSSAQEKKEIVYYNWKDYTDKTILEDFEKKYGIKVILKEYETRDMMFSEFQSSPSDYDVINASDNSVSWLIQSRLVSELDLAKIPNQKYIKESFRRLPFDPEGKYSLAGSLWGTVGFAINTNFVPSDTDSWSVFWDSKYKGKVALMDDYRDALAAILKYSHYSVNTVNPKELEVAMANAVLLRDNRVELGDTLGNIEKLMSGELWIAQAFNSDVIYKIEERKDIKVVFPKEGFCLTIDNYVISADSIHKQEAHLLINFFLEPQNAAKTANMFRYPTTINADAYINKDLLANPVIYPPQNVLQKGDYLLDVGEADGEYARIFNALKQIK